MLALRLRKALGKVASGLQWCGQYAYLKWGTSQSLCFFFCTKSFGAVQTKCAAVLVPRSRARGARAAEVERPPLSEVEKRQLTANYDHTVRGLGDVLKVVCFALKVAGHGR